MALNVSWGGMWDIFGTLQHLATCKSCKSCNAYSASNVNPLKLVELQNRLDKIQNIRHLNSTQSNMTVKMKRSKGVEDAKICKAILIAYARTCKDMQGHWIIVSSLDICHCARPVVQAVSWALCEDLVPIQSCDPSHSFPEGFQTAEDHVVSQPPASAHDASCTADTICGGIRCFSGVSMYFFQNVTKVTRRLQCWHPASPSWSTLATSPLTCRSTVVTQSCSSPVLARFPSIRTWRRWRRCCLEAKNTVIWKDCMAASDCTLKLPTHNAVPTRPHQTRLAQRDSDSCGTHPVNSDELWVKFIENHRKLLRFI